MISPAAAERTVAKEGNEGTREKQLGLLLMANGHTDQLSPTRNPSKVQSKTDPRTQRETRGQFDVKNVCFHSVLSGVLPHPEAMRCP